MGSVVPGSVVPAPVAPPGPARTTVMPAPILSFLPAVLDFASKDCVVPLSARFKMQPAPALHRHAVVVSAMKADPITALTRMSALGAEPVEQSARVQSPHAVHLAHA